MNQAPGRTVRAGARFLVAACAALLVAPLGLGCSAYGDGSDDMSLSPQADEAAAAGASATYTVTFTGAWTAEATPGGVPDGAHFSPLIGGVHNADVAFLEAGGTATPGIESMAERGRTATLTEEIQAAGANALSALRKDSGPGATASDTFEAVTVTARPSPNHLALDDRAEPGLVCRSLRSLLARCGGELGRSAQSDLYPWDAGTEGGDDFSFDNAATVPPGTIVSLRGTGRFSDAPIATLTFSLQSGA